MIKLSTFYNMTKVCSKCGIEKDLESGFATDNGRTDGRQRNCRNCSSNIAKLWRKQHPNRSRTISYKWKDRNPNKVKNIDRAKKAKRRAATANTIGESYKAADIPELLIVQRGLCAYCRGKLESYHVEHVIPLSRGGDNSLANIVLACPPCNLSKSNKLLQEWIPKKH